MPGYALPESRPRPSLRPRTAWLVASGDLREAPNRAGWAVQEQMEHALSEAFAELGWSVYRAHAVDERRGHGFLSSQREGIDTFAGIPLDAPLVVAESVWQYSHHLLAGLRSHRGPILTVANFSGGAPGLVGLLGLNAGLVKMGVPYSTLWSVDFTDEWFVTGLRIWTEQGRIDHDLSHVRPLTEVSPGDERDLGEALAMHMLESKAIVGIFDEGCMGMYNAIIDDELMNAIGLYKERLSQSALWAEMLRVREEEARAVLDWLIDRGMTFRFGTDEETELTERQVLEQARMYIALLRIGDDFGVDALGIQYQQGLKDICAASDLAEGLINNVERPPVFSRDGSRELWPGQAIPLANEADEGVAIDALVTNRVWRAMGIDPATTLHDVRWGEQYGDDFVWVFEISGSVPPSHFVRGYADAQGWRQNPMYFPLGGSTVRGVSKPGEFVWSRVFVEGGRLHADIGRGTALALPDDETERRWQSTNPEWPIMHAVLHGVSRNQLMARHRANHVQIGYATSADEADRALAAKSAMLHGLGISVNLVGGVRV